MPLLGDEDRWLVDGIERRLVKAWFDLACLEVDGWGLGDLRRLLVDERFFPLSTGLAFVGTADET